jgi:hypothetical protein
MLRIIAAAFTLAAIGCSHAGPYVQNIRVDMDGNLTVDKCLIEYNGWTGGLGSTECTTEVIKLHSGGTPAAPPTPIPPPKS